MPERFVGIQDLRRILRESAGVDPGVDLDADIADTDFLDLGYDSVAVLEVLARVSREYGRPVDDEALAAASTPRQLLDLLNRRTP
jgi:act minimal PKS acyl carrier protein